MKNDFRNLARLALSEVALFALRVDPALALGAAVLSIATIAGMQGASPAMRSAALISGDVLQSRIEPVVSAAPQINISSSPARPTGPGTKFTPGSGPTFS